MIVFFTNRLNHHQSQIADELYKITSGEYKFVELCPPNQESKKGDDSDYTSRPYLLQAWKGDKNKAVAYTLALESEVCVFGTIASLKYAKARVKKGMLSFDMGERWLKQGLKNVFSPTIFRLIVAYYINGWRNKPIYRLCMSAYAASDHAQLGMYKGKCYKWGYFTSVPEISIDLLNKFQGNTNGPIRLMWCGRFIKLKHPEMPIKMAVYLKSRGYSFILDYYGDGVELEATKHNAECMGLNDCVKFYGAVSNAIVLDAMRKHDIFLFTSNRLEGWGAVVNEAMSCGCVVVGNNQVGSVPYLIKDGVTGFRYNDTLKSLNEKVEWLINNSDTMRIMQKNAYCQMRELWSPANAARSLLQLVNDLSNGKEPSIVEGPCSKA